MNTRAFELAASAAPARSWTLKDELAAPLQAGRGGGGVPRPRPSCGGQLDYYLAHPDEARDIGERARKRALAEHTLRHRIEAMIAVLER